MLLINVGCMSCVAGFVQLKFDAETDNCADVKKFLRTLGWTFTDEPGSLCKVVCPVCSLKLESVTEGFQPDGSYVVRIHSSETIEDVVKRHAGVLCLVDGTLALNTKNKLPPVIRIKHGEREMAEWTT